MGCTIATATWWIGYRTILQFSPILLAALTLLLLLVLIPGIGREVNGSHRWLSLGGISIQPSEFAKLLIPLFYIQQVRSIEISSVSFPDFLKFLIPMGIPTFLILIEPDNGTVFVIGSIMLMLFVLSRVPAKYWGVPLLVCVLVGGFSAYQLSYVSARLKVYLNPELDIKGKGHQPHQAKIAAGSGKMLGKGPGNSWQKLSYLPEAQNDYIAAIYAEEFGFLGIVTLVLLYMTLCYLGFSIAHHAATLAGFYLSAMVIFLIGFQAFLNLGVVSGLLPSTGLNLPFFSQGGSSLIANLIAIGLLISVRDDKKQLEARV